MQVRVSIMDPLPQVAEQPAPLHAPQTQSPEGEGVGIEPGGAGFGEGTGTDTREHGCGNSR